MRLEAGDMEWSNDKTVAFIEDYPNSPELWNNKTPVYKDIKLRNDKLTQFSGKYDCTSMELKKKIKNLRSAFHRERKKLQEKKSGSSPSKKGKWFAYELLSLLIGVDVPKTTSSTAGSDEEEFDKQPPRLEQIQREIQQVKDDYRNRKKVKNEEDKDSNDRGISNEILDEYRANLVKYGKMQSDLPQKGSSRETFTLQLLAKFQNKLKAAKRKVEDDDKPTAHDDDDDWMSHPLKFEEGPVLARDANTKGDDWFDITDPRNAINKRRRETSKAELEKLAKTL